ncbi:MAG TPA: hypothetical protein VL171_17905 [Verrucomicrobiae bacterium]|nr:hypothetical protein [Verrucomicrobiae bacterium]
MIRNYTSVPPASREHTPSGIVAEASGPDSIAAAAGRDVHLHFGEKQKPRGRAKPPADVISEDQGIRLKSLMDEIIELDSASYGRRLSPSQLQQKWWGALAKVVPNTTYKNYSQKRFERAMKWLREQRGRLLAGVAPDEPELSRTAAIRAIHVHITRRKLDKLSYYAELSDRLGISPPFHSSKDLSDYDLQRVYLAVRRDAKSS